MGALKENRYILIDMCDRGLSGRMRALKENNTQKDVREVFCVRTSACYGTALEGRYLPQK